MDKYTATEQAYKHGYEKGYEAGKKDATDIIVGCKWIPVTEKLPEKDGRYLVFKQNFAFPWFDVLGFAKNGESVSRYDLENAKDVWYGYDSEYGYFSVDSVTHWMPLPEPPKVNK